MSILESLVHLNLATETVVQSTMYDGKQFSSSYQLRGYTECPKQVPTLSEGKQFPGQNLIIPRLFQYNLVGSYLSKGGFYGTHIHLEIFEVGTLNQEQACLYHIQIYIYSHI